MILRSIEAIIFFFTLPPTTKIYTLSLHDALPIYLQTWRFSPPGAFGPRSRTGRSSWPAPRSEEHTSELQSRENLVCRLLLEKKKAGCGICAGVSAGHRRMAV